MIVKGSSVKWKWGEGWAQGEVKQSFDHKVTKEIKGSKITKRGEPGNKALLIEQEDGTEVLKLEQEVRKK